MSSLVYLLVYSLQKNEPIFTAWCQRSTMFLSFVLSLPRYDYALQSWFRNATLAITRHETLHWIAAHAKWYARQIPALRHGASSQSDILVSSHGARRPRNVAEHFSTCRPNICRQNSFVAQTSGDPSEWSRRLMTFCHALASHQSPTIKGQLPANSDSPVKCPIKQCACGRAGACLKV